MDPQNQTGENPWEHIFQYAVQFHESGAPGEAASLFGAILEHHPEHLPSLQRLAAIRRQQGNLNDSLALLEKAVASWPGSAETHNSLANTLNALERPAEAIEHYRAAASLRAAFPEALLNLGNSLSRVNRLDEAVEAYGAALAQRKDFAEAHSGLALALDRLNQRVEALPHFQAAVELNPSIPRGYNNLAIALCDVNRHAEALPYFERARAAEPGAQEIAFHEALARLALGDFERGLRLYEARWESADFRDKRPVFAQPQWDGRSDLAGKTILLHTEQGLGDSILFARYVEMVAAKAGRVLIAASARLGPLLRSIPGVAQVIAPGEAIPDYDVHLPFGSLALVFGTTFDTIPAHAPYLAAPASAEPFLTGARGAQRPRVGVCWAGSAAYRNDKNRSIPLAIFQDVLKQGGIDFISLQQNLRPGDAEILARYGNIDREATAREKDLGDTARLLAELDLVISVDTAIVHLAGALGRPVWVLAGFAPYWVWLRERSDSPWYPTARIFRQPAFGDWKSAIDVVAAELAAMDYQSIRTW